MDFIGITCINIKRNSGAGLKFKPFLIQDLAC